MSSHIFLPENVLKSAYLQICNKKEHESKNAIKVHNMSPNKLLYGFLDALINKSSKKGANKP